MAAGEVTGILPRLRLTGLVLTVMVHCMALCLCLLTAVVALGSKKKRPRIQNEFPGLRFLQSAEWGYVATRW